MAHAGEEIQLHVQILGVPEQESGNGENGAEQKAEEPRRWARGSVQWWLTVLVDMLMVLCGQSVATLLGRFYYNSGGNSKWMSALTVCGGSPLLAIPLLFTPPPSATEYQPAVAKMVPIFMGLGILVGSGNLMYSYALQYLPVSTLSLVGASQLGFNSVTSRLINAQRFTAHIANSVVLLTLSAALLGVGSSSDDTSGHLSRGKYPIGFVLTLCASFTGALVLSLVEFTFDKVIRTRTLQWVLRVQMWASVAAAMVAVAGLFASGEWRTIPGEVAAFKSGTAGYVAMLVATAVTWQAAAVGSMRLVARVSSLFANVTSTVALPLVPVFAVVFFRDKMTGIKAIAMLMAVWGFLSYVYQHYIDGRRAAEESRRAADCSVCKARTEGD